LSAPLATPPPHAAPSSGWGRWLPGLAQLRGYQRGWLASDVTAGLVLSALLVPAGMAYAQASGLPAVSGLYATIVPLLVYACFGPSRVLVLGPDSSLAPLLAATIVPLAAGDPGRAVALGGMISLFAGLLCVVAGLARFGFLAELLSSPVRAGYLNGVALTIVVSQLATLLGLPPARGELLGAAHSLVDGLARGGGNLWALGLGGGAVGLMLAVQRWAPRVPGTLLALVGATVVVKLLGLEQPVLALVGPLPRGVPAPAWPAVSPGELPSLLGVSLGVAFLAFTDTAVLSRALALRSRRDVDPSQELTALGLVNVASGLFGGFVVSGSQTRTPVAESAGARTQLTGVVAAVVVTVLVTLAPEAFASLPQAALAAVVLVASLKLVELSALRRLWHHRRSEFALSLVAFVGVAVLGPLTGVGVAIALSLLNFMRQAWRPHATELVRVDGLKGYHDAERHPEGRRVPGLLLYRFDAPLFFANAAHFVSDVLRRVDGAPGTLQRVVVTAEPITDVDSTAVEALLQLLDALAAKGVALGFAELKGHVRERLHGTGVLERVGPTHLHRTVGEAVRRHVADAGVDWVDWEDRQAPPG